MKQLFLGTMLVLFLSSCGGCCNQCGVNSSSANDTLAVGDTLEDVEVYEYTGSEANDSSEVSYLLVIRSLTPLADGEYEMTTTYMDLQDGNTYSHYDKGKKKTRRGTSQNSDAVLYELVSDGNGDAVFFEAEADTALTALNHNNSKSQTRLHRKN